MKNNEVNHFFEIFTGELSSKAVKWTPYFEAYKLHLSKFINTDCSIIEIGVSEGGSLDYWKKCLGNKAKVVGIDVNPDCKKFDNPNRNIYVEIGDARNKDFTDQLIRKYGCPDIIIDDGDHRSGSIKSSLVNLWPYLNKDGIYMIEDIHGIYWQSQETWDTSLIEFLWGLMKSLNSKGSRGNLEPDKIFYNLQTLSFDWSLATLRKGKDNALRPICVKSSQGEFEVVVESSF